MGLITEPSKGEAFDMGQVAFREGTSRSKCIFHARNKLRLSWLRGWNRAFNLYRQKYIMNGVA